MWRAVRDIAECIQVLGGREFEANFSSMTNLVGGSMGTLRLFSRRVFLPILARESISGAIAMVSEGSFT